MENGVPLMRPCGRTERAPECWRDRSGRLYLELRPRARSLVRRGYGAAIAEPDLEDIYNTAWASSLSTLKSRADAMSDDDVRSYVLTAVAHQASRELRRRRRRPAESLDTGVELVDGSEPLPEERLASSEVAALVRDLLESLPQRRRTVLTLRYGWGLEPREVCNLVDGLSRRSYRREVERGVRELAEAMRLAEAGEWCESRQELVASLVAGTATSSQRSQAQSHLAHCGACRTLASRLRQGLMGIEVLGATMVVGGISQALGSTPAEGGGILDRALQAPVQIRDSMTSLLGRGGESEGVAAALAAGGGRGSGAAAAGGLVAKLAGLGTTAKVASACLATGAAATACVAAGVGPLPQGLAAGDERERVVRLADDEVHATTPLEIPDQIRDPGHLGSAPQAPQAAQGPGPARPQTNVDEPARGGGEDTTDSPPGGTAAAHEPIESIATSEREVHSIELGASPVTTTTRDRPERQQIPPAGRAGGSGGGGGDGGSGARSNGGAEFGP